MGDRNWKERGEGAKIRPWTEEVEPRYAENVFRKKQGPKRAEWGAWSRGEGEGKQVGNGHKRRKQSGDEACGRSGAPVANTDTSTTEMSNHDPDGDGHDHSPDVTTSLA